MNKFLKNLLRLVRKMIWFCSKYIHVKLKATTVQGVFLIPPSSIRVNDFISKSLYVDKCFEYDFYRRSIDFLKTKKFLSEEGNNTLIDVGINNGVISIGALLSNDFNYSIGFDGCKNHIENCRANVEINYLNDKISLVHAVLSDSNKTVLFENSISDFGQHRVVGQTNKDFQFLFNEEKNLKEEVRSRTLDSLLTPFSKKLTNDNNLLWIDVEGHEGFIFKGASNLLKTNLPCIMELCPYMIQRTGMDQKTYTEIIQNHWDQFWILRDYKIVNYPTSVIGNFMQEIDGNGSYSNIILTP
jgi:FkbM family methyltransferase